MAKNESVLKFQEVSFAYNPQKVILQNTNFSLRRGSKTTLMGQNGAGKTTLFQILTGELEPTDGTIIRHHKLSIAISKQVIPYDQKHFTVREFFQNVFTETIYDIDNKINEILEVVNLKIKDEDYDRAVQTFSGGQQARLLLASALIQKPDLLLLDEPTNNLDVEGIAHLTEFLQNYRKTVIVISHDAEFLNNFTTGVLYLNVFTKQITQYTGNYLDVLEQVGIQTQKEKRQHARLNKQIQDKKDKANFFANKGGRLRAVAKQMREDAAEAEANKATLHQEDKTIREFTIPTQANIGAELIKINSILKKNKKGQFKPKQCDVSLRKGDRLLLKGPNGIGKSTFLEKLAQHQADGAEMQKTLKLGYYRQDFTNLNFKQIVYQCLMESMKEKSEQKLRSTAAGFLIDKHLMNNEIHTLSEGQKGLVSFARLVLMQPGVLILDEPTNHINFRHLPIIAKAINNFEGAIILVTHNEEFLEDIEVTQEVDLG